MADEGENRTHGIEFGSLDDTLETVSYPIANDELVESYGDRELDLETDVSTLEEVLGPLDEKTYDSPAEVKQTILSMVGEDAVGREGYSDRGGSAPGIDEDDQSV